ncbi:MAG: nuclear transport factor 2 family protein [Nitrososphaera sp.]|uniref:nuclear transport factor 2 family protein n=1 Tax=Nitrososphaera sp. TaxID=1971748 RepID=UPI003D6FFFA0
MSSIELVKKFYALFKAGDKQGYLSLCDDAIEWNTMQGMPAGDSIVVLGKYSGRSRTGKEFEAPFAHVYAVRNNRIASFRQYTDTAIIQQALAPG